MRYWNNELKAMCDMWKCVCDSYGWDPHHMRQFTDIMELVNRLDDTGEVLVPVSPEDTIKIQKSVYDSPIHELQDKIEQKVKLSEEIESLLKSFPNISTKFKPRGEN